ncbi:proline iminopeptidase [Cognatiyoonia sediminum]|uniref:Proline iminopeptidase n=1 Tax=Cognatiyoonia sediminum TaxID=1508389 RepID=A0A1M5NFQ9_9RHOB|nr:alpha/beta hydrolase [Cognatiyoonia sediminum]SHG88039.1 proline iminopeptidase [Cognatiyoonia sediminum]
MKKTTLGLAAALMGATAAAAEMIEVNGANLFYESIGSGEPILVMHGGLGLSHDYLRPYFDQLSETNTVVYYDHLGNGLSDKPDDYAEMNFDRLTSDAAELMTALGHDTFTLIGHSYGGFITQEFAINYADRLDGLVLVDTVPAFDYQPTVSGPDENMAAFGKLFTQPMADNDDWRATWNPVAEIYFHQWDPDVGADLDELTNYEYRAWNAAGALLGTFNTLEDLPNVPTRALVIAGRHDGITVPDAGAERIAGLLPNATLMIFEESGHYPFIEEEAAFFEALNGWLAE